MIKKQEIIKVLKVLIDDAEHRKTETIKNNAPFWKEFETWRTACLGTILELYKSENNYLYRSFSEIRFTQARLPGQPHDPRGSLITFIVGLEIAIEKLKGLLLLVNIWIPEDDHSQETPVIFISHSTKAKTITNKIKNFLKEFGAIPILVEELPSLNLSVDQKIRLYMKQCNIGLAILTSDDKLVSGEKQPRQNVTHEIGLMQESSSINGKIIYLKETSVKLPSNYSEKVWISFSKSDLDETFIKIIREIKNWGFRI